MEKFNREVNELRVVKSKERTINNVMDRINKKKSFWSIFKPAKLRLALSIFSVFLVIALGIVLSLPNAQNPRNLSEFETKKLVETSYMSASIISNATINSVSTSLSFLPLMEIETEFEKNIDDFNYYFNMLKVFVDEDDFYDLANFEVLENELYDYKISYSVNDKEFVFLVSISEDGEILGEITIGNKTLVVEGTLEEKENSLELDLIARKNDDYIIIEYKSETEDEIEKKYFVKQSINGVYLEKEITIEKEMGETKVEIKQGEDQYLLEMYENNGKTIYYLEYEVNDLEGEVYITEDIDSFGKTIYRYHINEDGVEKDIDLEDPDEDDEDDEEDDKEDDEDDEEEDDDDLMYYGTGFILNL
ncbi:MAG: hypothetical protein AB7S96_01885 [Candidatus Izemoplasmatales bacterium]|jgi:hypothetical protein